MTQAGVLKSGRVRIGVVGIRRGKAFASIMHQHPDADLVAVCDLNTARLEQFKQLPWAADVTTYTSYEQMLEHDLDAIVLANDAHEHVPLALQALKSGRHVLSEVPACETMGEAVDLVEAVERTGLIYMMAENYCFRPASSEMRRLYQAGDIGEFQHGEGEYIHDTEHMWAQLTGGQKNHWRNWRSSTFYCTHSLAPILYVTGTRVLKVVAMETPNRCGYRYGRLHGDSAMLMCQVSNGGTVKSLHSHGGLKREPASYWQCIYGTKGTMEADRWVGKHLHVYREGQGKESYNPDYAVSHNLGEYAAVAQQISGHGGADFFTSHYFLQSVLGRCEIKIDVYRALDMTLPGLFGHKSILNGNQPFDVPDLRNKAERERWRGDNWCLDPKYAAPGNPTHPCSFPVPEVPERVYAEQEEEARAAGYPPVERM